MYRTVIFRLGAALMFAGMASAQALPATGTGPQPVTANRVPDAAPGAFRQLSPGNQKIAQALFDAQQARTAARFGASTASPGPNSRAPDGGPSSKR